MPKLHALVEYILFITKIDVKCLPKWEMLFPTPFVIMDYHEMNEFL